MVELLRQLERRAGAPIWTLFDVIGGTSTGGLLAVSLGILRLKLDACQEIYTSLGNKVCLCIFLACCGCDQHIRGYIHCGALGACTGSPAPSTHLCMAVCPTSSEPLH